jgi:hypothetical protein
MEVAVNSIARHTPSLSNEEWTLVLQLVEREDALLPVEISHSATRRMREELRARMTMVEQIATKIRCAVSEMA